MPVTWTPGRRLSDLEVKFLLEQAERYSASRDYRRSLDCYSRIVEGAPPHPQYFKRRTLIRRLLGDLDGAIADMNRAVELDPDDANSYWERGACFSHKLSLNKDIDRAKREELLGKILADYKASVTRNPTSAEGWLAIVETDLLMHDWDDAIGNYGSCKPYIDSKSNQLVRSWLGTLALDLAGDAPDEEDRKLLDDMSIRLNDSAWCVSEIESLLAELESEGFDREKLRKTKETHRRFLEHFDEPPLGGKKA